MKTLIAKLHGQTIATKTVKESNPMELHQFMFEVNRKTNNKHSNDIKITVRKTSSLISECFGFK